MANITNPSVDERSDTKHWTGPIGNGTVLTGPIYLQGAAAVLPTSDPAVAGQLWLNSNVLTVSAG
jgi:hypothetical protein